MENEFVPDSVVQEITERFINRAKFGKQKYGVDLDRTDLTPAQWAQHGIEEAHDLMLYLTKWKREQEKQTRLIELLMMEYGQLYDLTDEERTELDELIEWYHQNNDLTL